MAQATTIRSLRRRPATRRDGAPRVRQWMAAKSSRLFADWTIVADDLNDEMRSAIPLVRGRARELEQNNDIAARYLRLAESHIVGPNGFKLQVRGELATGKADLRGNSKVERAFATWCEPQYCDIGGRQSFADLTRTLVRTVARDGECLIRLHDNITTDNPFGFFFFIIDTQRLDHQHNIDGRSGKSIRLGIEVDANNRPINYYLTTDKLSGIRRHIVLPAEEVIHLYRPDRPGQLRGMSWMAPVMPTLHILEKYQESALVAAREGANKMGFYETPEIGDQLLNDSNPAANDGELYEESEAGMFGMLPPGYTFKGWDPTYPHEIFESFIRTYHRTAAQGLSVSYHALTGDLTGVNFASIRSGTLEEREHWQVHQNWLISWFLRPVYLRWLQRSAALAAIPRISQDVDSTIRRYSAHHWQGRRWPWVDPFKDIMTAIKAIEYKLKSPQQVAMEMGLDVDEVLDQIAQYQELLEGYKLTDGVSSTPTESMNNAA